ncbi:MAG: tRNA pseudouridine(38-40) synthase TruA [Candidatus Poribacteria bacterium]|nr:tRNA pseudouridine(38-40) synthase TruA [Candidatus Poribacteria bacterium]
MRTVKLTIEYDGTDYAGWQHQENALAVQTVIERALGKLIGEPTRIHGAGRTDAGVHAAGQVAHFVTESPIPPDGMLIALNGMLPTDIAVTHIEDVDANFHARFGATARTYEYTVLNRVAPSALMGRYVWHIRKRLPVEAWDVLAGVLVGERDYSSFEKKGSDRDQPLCDVSDCRAWRDGDLVKLSITARSFLRGMVRAIVGTFYQLAPDESADTVEATQHLRAIIAARDRSAAGDNAPASGLCLMKVTY